MQSFNLKMKKSSNALLDLIVWTRVTSYISVVSLMSTIPTVMVMRSLVPHISTPVKFPGARSLYTTMITSLA